VWVEHAAGFALLRAGNDALVDDQFGAVDFIEGENKTLAAGVPHDGQVAGGEVEARRLLAADVVDDGVRRLAERGG
jgi:hypothetical protein